jgi:hypothetical protein
MEAGRLVTALAPAAYVGHLISRFPPLRAFKGFPNAAKAITALAGEAAVDRDLLCHLMNTAMFTERTRFTARDLKFTANQWIRENRKSWTPIMAFGQMSRAIPTAMTAGFAEEAMFDYWAAPDNAGVVGRLRAYAASGSVAGTAAH